MKRVLGWILLSLSWPMLVQAQSTETINVQGLSAPVDIFTPATGIPSITASSDCCRLKAVPKNFP